MDPLSKFQSLLNEIFQFEASDLDFGIYRILNFKRDQIDKFIKEDIKNIVENAFSKHRHERLQNITQKFEDARKKVSETLGEIALTPTGDIKAEFRDTIVGKDYLLLKEQKDLAGKIDEVKLQVFNDLYTFFSRYYEEGDFVPQYRYSIKNFRYAIPYNGEEVKLYWANEGQYYTKTGILFTDYAFFSDPGKTYKIIFRTVSAREELSSNKATKARFFVLHDENPITPLHPPLTNGGEKAIIHPPLTKEGQRGVTIRFQYRELTDKEVKLFDVEGGSNTAKQVRINQIDTRHFSQEFKERLLEKLTENTDLDDLLDGLLIKSENWQALNLLMEKYRAKVKCIHIDPPYNTGQDEFIYN